MNKQTTRDKLIDVVARVISNAPFPSGRSLTRAEATLKAINDAGFAIVPNEQYEALIKSGEIKSA